MLRLSTTAPLNTARPGCDAAAIPAHFPSSIGGKCSRRTLFMILDYRTIPSCHATLDTVEETGGRVCTPGGHQKSKIGIAHLVEIAMIRI